MSTRGAILVVDDAAENLGLLASILTTDGYEVLPANSGQLALAAVAARAPDLILLDIRMPGLDGFEVCRRLKADPGSRDIPVMFISAFGESAERVEGFELGAVDFISKPIRSEELRARVRTHIELRRGRIELEASEARFHRAVLDSPFPILLHAEDGGIVLASNSWCEITGYTREELRTIGDWTERAYGERKLLVQTEIDRLYGLAHRVPEGDYTIRTRSGDTRIWDFSSGPLGRLPDGRRLVISMAMDVTDRRRAEAEALTSLREKEALLREVHHRVKNNLQVIHSLLRLETSRSEAEDTRRVLKDMQGRIMSMALLHETLYRSGHFGQVDLAPYLRQLAQQLVRATSAAGLVRLELDLSPIHVPIDQAIPCGLIVNELLANSLKHAFAEGQAGEVKLSLRQDTAGVVRMRVTDTGTGLPLDFEARRGGSLGLQLVSDLARQLGGRLEVGPGPGAGFTVVFTATAPPETARIPGPLDES